MVGQPRVAPNRYRYVLSHRWHHRRGLCHPQMAALVFLKIVDFFLLSIGLHIIALGVYKLFINESIELPESMGSKSFDELKLTLIKLATIVLLLDFVEQALASRSSRELMEYGIAIAVILAAVSWGAKQLKFAEKGG